MKNMAGWQQGDGSRRENVKCEILRLNSQGVLRKEKSHRFRPWAANERNDAQKPESETKLLLVPGLSKLIKYSPTAFLN